jgi:hypothetical protein
MAKIPTYTPKEERAGNLPAKTVLSTRLAPIVQFQKSDSTITGVNQIIRILRKPTRAAIMRQWLRNLDIFLHSCFWNGRRNQDLAASIP